MFVKAIEKIYKFVRPINMISRYLGSTEIEPGAATFFYVNNQGYALMCYHTYENIQECKSSFSDYKEYKLLLEKAPKYGKKRVEYIKNLNKELYGECNTIQLDVSFLDAFTSIKPIDSIPEEDILLVKFDGVKTINEISPIFRKETSDIKEGKHLCQSGFAFPYFNNYKYNNETDKIEWTNEGIIASKLFNVDGMVARKLENQLIMTTPGYDGMSGSPVFDTEGRICGIQHHVKHAYTNFNCDKVKLWHSGIKHEVTQYPFAHFAICTSVDSIKELLRRNKVSFVEG